MRSRTSSASRRWMLPAISAKTGINIEEVLERIVTDIPAARGMTSSAPAAGADFRLRTMTAYKGVIVYIRV